MAPKNFPWWLNPKSWSINGHWTKILTWRVVTVSQHAKTVTFEITFEVLKDRWKIFGHFAGYSWFATTRQLKAAMLRVNTIHFFLNDVHKSRVLFPDERNTFVLDHQHGRCDITCKPAGHSHGKFKGVTPTSTLPYFD